MNWQTASEKFNLCLNQLMWKTCLEIRSVLITGFLPSCRQTDLSAIYSGPEVAISSCADVHSIYIT